MFYTQYNLRTAIEACQGKSVAKREAEGTKAEGKDGEKTTETRRHGEKMVISVNRGVDKGSGMVDDTIM